MVDEALLNVLEDTVIEAGFALCERLKGVDPITPRHKIDGSIVTDIDIELDRLIQSRLAEFAPIVSEERPETHNLLNSAPVVWVVDPLDGTSNCRRFRGAQDTCVGFGPLVSLVENGKVRACSFFHAPNSTLFSAVQGAGAWSLKVSNPEAVRGTLKERTRLQSGRDAANSLKDCAVLFYPGTRGEIGFISHLEKHSLVEDLYDFGGFANDCTRISQGFEHILVQFSVGPWDFGATLFLHESGTTVIVDPIESPTPYEDWDVQLNNPVIACPPQLLEQVLGALRASGHPTANSDHPSLT